MGQVHAPGGAEGAHALMIENGAHFDLGVGSRLVSIL